MNRIEEIKERIEDMDEWYVDNLLFVDDIKYLLSKLEAAEKALEVAKRHIEGTAGKFSEREKTPVLYQLKEVLTSIRE